MIMPKNWGLVGLSGSVTDLVGGMLSSNTHGKDTWKNGNFDGKGKIVDDLGNFEQGDFIEGRFNWQWDYDFKKQLNGIWSIKQGAFNETIYFFPCNLKCPPCLSIFL